MRSWLYALIRGTIIPDHLGICDRCAAEFHGECLLAQQSYLVYGLCRCQRRKCVWKKMCPPGHNKYRSITTEGKVKCLKCGDLN